MTMWLRLWHDMPTDPKWRVVARKSGRSLTEVIAVFNLMMICASEAEDRGSLKAWDDEDAAACLDMDDEAVAAIRQAMEGKVIDAGRLAGWERRQPKREDSSAERVKEHREKKKAEANAPATPVTGSRNAAVTQCNAPEQSREEQNREEAAAQLSAREKFELLESQLRQAAGWENEAAPNLFVTGPIANLIEAGADLERDVLPTIKAKAATLRRPPGGGWSWFVPIIIEAREKRLGIAAKVAPAPVVAVTAEAWAARLGLYRKAGSWDREKWGPPPAEPGCEVPPELLPTPTEWPPAATATAA